MPDDSPEKQSYGAGARRIGTGGDDDRIELGRLGSELWRRKYLILACTLILAIVFYILVSQVTPRYTARASVMLDPRSVQVLSTDDVVSDLNLNNPLLDSEVALLRSNLLLEEVLSSFPPERLEAFDPGNRPVPPVTQAKRWVKSLLGMPEMTTARALMTPEELRMRRLTGALRKAQTVSREGQSYVINVSVETEDPELSALLANAIVKTYIARQIGSRVETVESATDFLARQVDAMRADVEQAEAAIEDFRINQLAQSGISPETVEQQLLDLSTQLALANADLAQARARYAQVQTQIDETGFEAAADLLTSPLVLSLRQQLLEFSREDTDLATRLGPDHPQRQRLASQITSLKTDLTEEVRKIVATLRNDVEVARIRANSIETSLRDMESRAADMSRASLQLRQLEREADAVRGNYESMLLRLNETRSIQQLQRADARIVERAVIPGAASAPRVLLMTTLGGTAGFSLGIIIAFFQMLASAGFARSRQIEDYIGVPVITWLPTGEWASLRGMLRALVATPYQGFAERLRQMRMALTLRQDRNMGGQCVMVTSSVAEEGKTSTAVALALVEAHAKRSAIVLDFDVRRSHLAQELGYDTTTDLAGLLLEGKPVDDAIHSVPEYGFDLITLSAHAPQLFDEAPSARLENLITMLKARYDLVVIDSPPLLLVADTKRMAQLADSVVLLVRQNKTRRSAVRESVRALEAVGVRSLGIVMTMVDPRGDEYDYIYSGY